MSTVNLYLRKRDAHLWRVAKALADEQGISMSALVTQAIKDYCVHHQVPMPDKTE